MKKSALKDIIREVMSEMLPELLEMVSESISETYTPQTVNQTQDVSYIRKNYKSNSDPADWYEDLPMKQTIKFNGPPPKNPKTIIDGESFASGKNIMEWFSKTASASPITAPSEFKHSGNDMDEYIAKKFGVK